MGKFADQNRAFADKAKLRTEVIFRDSSQRLMDKAGTPEGQGGKMPVDTSFLRNSAAASKEGMPSAESPAYSLVFSTMKLGETVWAGWTAVYAMRQEHGFQGTDSLGREYTQAGKGFMRAAAQSWDFIVAEAAAQAKKDIP